MDKEIQGTPVPAEATRLAGPASKLPATRPELLVLHEAARRRRDEAELGSREWAAASHEVAELEVEIARVERAMQPPLI